MLLTLVVGAVLVFILLTLMFEGTNRWSNLPSHIDSPEEWEGKDDSQHWYTDWRRYVKSWFAHDWRKPHWYGSLRRYPVTLFAVFGKGESRWENDFMALRSTNNTVVWYFPPKNGFYLSRVQYWCDWHIQIQWPLFICWHIKLSKTLTIGGYAGVKRDTNCYWFFAFWLGTGYK